MIREEDTSEQFGPPTEINSPEPASSPEVHPEESETPKTAESITAENGEKILGALRSSQSHEILAALNESDDEIRKVLDALSDDEIFDALKTLRSREHVLDNRIISGTHSLGVLAKKNELAEWREELSKVHAGIALLSRT